MKKRSLAILLTVAMLLTIVPTAALAEDIGDQAAYASDTDTAYAPADTYEEAADAAYSLESTEPAAEDTADFSDSAAAETTASASGTCGDNLTWVLDNSGTLTISGTGAMADYNADAAPWYSYEDSITSVVIKSGVTHIGQCSFVDLKHLTSVIIPASVVSIAESGFTDCTSLTSVTAPDRIASIGSNAFYGCTGLADADGFITVCGGLYGYTGSAESVVIPNGVTTIGFKAFCDSRITNVTIPDSVTSIGEFAFQNCDSLTSVKIPDSVTSIGSEAFYDCGSLASVTFPDSVASIGEYVFTRCFGLADSDGAVVVGGVKYDQILETKAAVIAYVKEQLKERNPRIIYSLKAPASEQECDFDAYTGISDEGDYLYSIIGDHNTVTLGHTYDEETGEYDSTYALNVGYRTTSAQEEAVTAKVHEVLEELQLSGLPDYEKILAIYDYICTNVIYDKGTYAEDTGIMYHSEISHTAYGALINGTAVPDGYVYLLYRMLVEAGIDCRVVTGISNNQSYKWNIVRIGTKFYNVDVATDAFEQQKGCARICFLKNDASFCTYTRDSKYTTDAFNAAYPMSETDFTTQVCTSHTWDEGIVTVNPTPESEGTRVYTCTVCGDAYRETIPRRQACATHSWDDGVVTREPSTDLEGIRLYTCTVCGETYTETIEKLPDTDSTVYIARGQCGEALSWKLSENGELIISGTGSMDDYKYDMQPWHSYLNTIHSVVVKDGVTGIGSNAFNCISVDFSGLQEVSLADSVTSIGDSAFFYCRNLTDITIPDSITKIGEYAFEHCSALQTLVIPVSVKSIGGGAFFDCDSLTDFHYAGTLAQWNQVETHDTGDELYRIIIDGETVGEVLYSGACGASLSWQLDDTGKLTISGTGAMTEYSYYEVPWNAYRKSIKKLVIGNGTSSICTYAFCNCSGLTSAVIADTVTSIGKKAFGECSGLTEIQLPAQLTSLGENAFAQCYGLTSVTIPGTITSYGYSAFNSCTNLTSVTISDGATGIYDYTFMYCENLRSVTIPASVKNISEGVFLNCSSLQDIWFTGTEAQWNSISIHDNNPEITAAAKHFRTNYSYDIAASEDDQQENTVTASQQAEVFNEIQHTKGETVFTAQESDGRLEYSWTFDGEAITDPDTAVSSFKVEVIEATDEVVEAAAREEVTEGLAVKFEHEGALPGTAEIQLNVGSSYADGTYLLYYFNSTTGKMEDTGTWATVKDGIATFSIMHCSVYYIELKNNPFTDNRDSAKYYFSPIRWAVDMGITTGYSDGTFLPNADCSRANIVTFLWRAYGSPEPETTENPFTDVVEGRYYYKAVLWAVENGITNGFEDGTFRPNDYCTRGQAVTFIWRAAGQPVPTTAETKFTDVVAGKYYYNAVLWAVENSITTGYSDGTFQPNKTCTRGNIVTFLYRALAE